MKMKKKLNRGMISRKDAIFKVVSYGKYAALTALGTYFLLDPKRTQASSPSGPDNPGIGF